MNVTLSDVEIRVLGCLIEKEKTTPEYYPMSLNALTTACNQKTNRDPVVSYDETTVADALDSLREQDLVIVVRGKESRVVKYDNYFADKLHLSAKETAAMCILMLRGPQTAGEIRTRTERLYDFANIEEVEATLDGLAAREEGPLVVKLCRQPGQKECRYAHLLAGEVDALAFGSAPESIGDDRIESLEIEVAELRQELDALKQQFAEFRKQFD